MLVLSRKLNQKVQIGNDIVVTVVKVKGNVIRLGIEAPKDVRVLRSELEVTVDKSLTDGLEHDSEPTARRRAPLSAFLVASSAAGPTSIQSTPTLYPVTP